MSKNTSSLWLQIIAATILFSIFTVLRIGNHEVRTANAISDDHPVVLANYLKEPEKWRNDTLELMGPAYLRTSIEYWAPALLYKKWGISPSLLSLLIVLIQNVGLAIALLLYCRTLSANPKSYWCIAIATFASQPWLANLAYYPNVMHSPYAGHLVVPFLILAGTAFLQNRLAPTVLSLIIAGSIHASHTLHLLLILALYVLLESSARKYALKYFAWFLLIALGSSLPPLLLTQPTHNPLSNAEILPTLLINFHLRPWQNEPFWTWGITTLSGIFLSSYIAIKKRPGPQSKLQSFFFANLLAILIAGAVQVFAVQAQIPNLMLLCPLRVSVLTALFLLPLVYSFIFEKLKSPDWAVRFSGVMAMLLQILSSVGFYWGQLLPLFVESERWRKYRRLSVPALVILAWFGVFIFSGRPMRLLGLEAIGYKTRFWLAPGGGFETSSFFFTLSLSVVLVYLSSKLKSELFQTLLVLTLIGYASNQVYIEGKGTQKGPLRDRYELQKWARDHTPTDSLFLLRAQSWRGISQRAAIFADRSPLGLQPYFRFREAKDRIEKLDKMYQEQGVKDFEDLSEEGILSFRAKLGGDYVLRPPEAPTLRFPEVFRNSVGVIYKIEEMQPILSRK